MTSMIGENLLEERFNRGPQPTVIKMLHLIAELSCLRYSILMADKIECGYQNKEVLNYEI